MFTIPESILHVIRPLFYRIEQKVNRIRYNIRGEIVDPFRIPIYINNFNRLSNLKLLIDSLAQRGYNNIHIIDNASTYPPLLEYYNECPYEVIFLGRNVGHISIWETDIYSRVKHSYYVYSDSDMQIDDSCPSDFMTRFINILTKYPACHKVGFGLRIDDLPDCYYDKSAVISHERQFWQNRVEENLYIAPIDTTFALYRPYAKGPYNEFKLNMRTGFPYVIRHLPWYIDSSNMNSEELYYINHISTATHWSARI